MRKKQVGFTLVEVLVSLAIFFIVMILFGSLLQSNLLLNLRSLKINQNSSYVSNALIDSSNVKITPNTFVVEFTNDEKIQIEGNYESINTPTSTVADLYQKFKTTSITPQN